MDQSEILADKRGYDEKLTKLVKSSEADYPMLAYSPYKRLGVLTKNFIFGVVKSYSSPDSKTPGRKLNNT